MRKLARRIRESEGSPFVELVIIALTPWLIADWIRQGFSWWSVGVAAFVWLWCLYEVIWRLTEPMGRPPLRTGAKVPLTLGGGTVDFRIVTITTAPGGIEVYMETEASLRKHNTYES
jgi:hypothetical protein